MSIDWSLVTAEHVREACRKFDSGLGEGRRAARNTFLVVDSKRYPAKFIRGLAYQIATGVELDPSRDYSGGAETADFLSKLGFVVDYTPSTRGDEDE